MAAGRLGQSGHLDPAGLLGRPISLMIGTMTITIALRWASITFRDTIGKMALTSLAITGPTPTAVFGITGVHKAMSTRTPGRLARDYRLLAGDEGEGVIGVIL
jgi:hypothetical protein